MKKLLLAFVAFLVIGFSIDKYNGYPKLKSEATPVSASAVSSTPTYAATLTSDERKAYGATVLNVCKSDLEKAGLSKTKSAKASSNDLCICYSVLVAEAVTLDDINYYKRTGQFSQKQLNDNGNINVICAATQTRR